MKKINLTIYIFCILLGTSACQKQELMNYESGSDIYFSGKSINGVYQNEEIRSFAMKSASNMEDSVSVPVMVLGPVSSSARPFKITVDESQTTAILGKHYRLPSDTIYNIPAGKVSRTFKVKILRDMYQDSVKIVLKLMPNEHFQTSMPSYTTNVSTVPFTQFSIKADDFLPKPLWWDRLIAHMGTFSRLKLELYTRQANVPFGNIYTSYSDSQLIGYARNFQVYLNNQKNAGNTILELDGTAMIMGPSSQ